MNPITVKVEIADETLIKIGILIVMMMLFSLLVHFVKK